MQNEYVEKLWQDYNKTSDNNIKGKIIENYIPLIKHIVNRLNINLPPFLEYDDLISYGIFGLMQAVDRFDFKKGIKFETYAYTRIKGSIIDELRKVDSLSQGVRKKIKGLQDAFSELEQLLGRSVEDKDVCDYLNISLKELHSIYKEAAVFYGIQPFEDLLHSEDTGKQTDLPDIMAENKELKEILGNAIDRLPAQEKTVISLYYYEGLNFREISEVLKLSQGRISQLHTKAIFRLRGQLSRKRMCL